MNDYPYSIFYSVDKKKEEVEILAIIHNSRAQTPFMIGR
jgi:plasmid stabilization system protein ParE